MKELKLTTLDITELPVAHFIFTPENILYFKALIEANQKALLNEHLVNFDETRPVEFVKQLTLIKGAVHVLERLIADHEEALSKVNELKQENNSASQE